MKRKRVFLIILIVILLLIFAGYLLRDEIYRQFFKPTESTLETGVTTAKLNKDTTIKVIASNLDIPWGVAFLPNGETLVTERSGDLKRIDDGKTFTIGGVQHIGEGGLLGLVSHPNFVQNRYLYLYLTTKTTTGLTNRVERYVYQNNELSSRKVIIENIPGASFHDGGRLAFGPDGLLYITTGDAGNETSAQNTSSLAGKILRVTDTGAIPSDNPFNNAVYSFGHRNPQGIAWDEQGQLWSTEHGPSGAQTGFDELNLIKLGGNYGWSEIKGNETKAGMISPVAQSGANETWAPAGLTYLNGSLFFGGLRGESLYQAVITNNSSVSLKAHFRSEYGRIRTTIVGPQGDLFITTSNKDGRGNSNSNDDKLIQLSPEIFN